jgi:hypothetical protein
MRMVKVGATYINLDQVAYVTDNRGAPAAVAAYVWVEFTGTDGDEGRSLRLDGDEAAMFLAYLDRQSEDLDTYADDLARELARAAAATPPALAEIPF